MMAGIKVAVIGAGVTGLATLKNLREEGFDAQCFESTDFIGGVWSFSEKEDETSILQTTISNKSKYKNSFTDFPYHKDMPDFPSGEQVQQYLESYAETFDIRRHIQTNTRVVEVVRNGDDTKWIVRLLQDGQDKKSMEFDKVVVCIGAWIYPKLPKFEGQDLFQGKIIHSREFKRPADFSGKRLVVLGLGNTAADTSTTLVGHASEVYLSHRRGANLLPRIVDGKPLDLSITQRHTSFKTLLNAISPPLTESFFNMFIQSLTNKSFRLDQKWRIHPPPSFATHQPTISDNLVKYLTDGSIKSAAAIQRFVSSNEVEFEDGSIAEVDVVICCTGYSRGFDLIPELQPKPNTPLKWAEHPNSDGRSLPRLYQNIFPPTRGDSIAYLNNFTLPRGFFHIADLAAMAVTQTWKENPPLPSQELMNKAIDAHHEWMISLVQKETVITDLVREEIWMKWVRKTAGTSVDEMLGYGLEGWKFWARDWRFCNLLMGGIESPLVDRVFDGKRKKWDAARQAIVNQNEEVEERSRSASVSKKD